MVMWNSNVDALVSGSCFLGLVLGSGEGDGFAWGSSEEPGRVE